MSGLSPVKGNCNGFSYQPIELAMGTRLLLSVRSNKKGKRPGLPGRLCIVESHAPSCCTRN